MRNRTWPWGNSFWGPLAVLGPLGPWKGPKARGLAGLEQGFGTQFPSKGALGEGYFWNSQGKNLGLKGPNLAQFSFWEFARG